MFGFAQVEQMFIRWAHNGALLPESVALIRERLADDGAWSWHDHRAHWMGDEPPIGLEPGDALPDMVIELVVDGGITLKYA